MAYRFATRDYQAAAVDAALGYLQTQPGRAPLIVIPTGGGKTPTIAELATACVERGPRVLCVSHSKELIRQTHGPLNRIVGTMYPVGIYSAGLGRRDTQAAIIVAGVQSVYRRMHELGPFGLILVDEAHIVNPDGDGMYREMLAGAFAVNPRVRMAGLTATPFRMKGGIICREEGPFHDICYESDVATLVRNGYLCPLVSRRAASSINADALPTAGDDFAAEPMEAAFAEAMGPACDELLRLTADRKSILTFTPGVAFGRAVASRIGGTFVDGETGSAEFDAAVAGFRDGTIRHLVNCRVFTTGFDATNTDCVALMMATKSPGLYAQVVGRGFRIDPRKTDCLILDYGGNVARHGPVDRLSEAVRRIARTGKAGECPVKACPACGLYQATGKRKCECGHEFPEPERAIFTGADPNAEPLSDGKPKPLPVESFAVDSMYLCEHVSKSNGKRMICAQYSCGNLKLVRVYVCVEHGGFPREKAEQWWSKHSDYPCPATVDEALGIYELGGLRKPSALRSRVKGGFDEVTGYEFTEAKPETIEQREGIDLEEFRAGLAKEREAEELRREIAAVFGGGNSYADEWAPF